MSLASSTLVGPAPTGTIVVTGATGFLGSHLSRALARDGIPVRALGRNVAKGLALTAAAGGDDGPLTFRPVPLADQPALITAMRGARAVVHCAALSSPWGTDAAFEAHNVHGTANVIAAAAAAGIARLIYISSPSVLSDARDRHQLTEADAAPATALSNYSRSKHAAEALIRAGPIPWVILRPKAIYGPGDNALLPRLIAAARSGRLRRIGDGHATTNLTHVRDVVAGIRLALHAPAAIGGTYTLTGGEATRLWDLIDEVTRRLGLPQPTGNISVANANRVARALETLWRGLRLPGEPPLTRYAVGILSYDNTYDIGAAQRDLGYQPHVTLSEGLDELFAVSPAAAPAIVPGSSRPFVPSGPSRQVAASPPDRTVDFTLLNGGTVRTRSLYFDVFGSLEPLRVPNLFAVIDHPTQGTILFDTGYTDRFHTATRHFPHCVYAAATPVDIPTDQTAIEQLRARGVDPNQVRWIILSHFHPDHCGGLRDFPNATVVCRAEAWTSVAGKSGLRALLALLLPGHLPDDLTARLRFLPSADAAPMTAAGVFPPLPGRRRALASPSARALFHSAYDLFGDGAIKLVDLPGHAAGQIGAWVRSTTGVSYLLIADAVWTRRSIHVPNRGLHRLIARSTRQRDATVRALQRLQYEHPDTHLIPSHCPATAATFGINLSPIDERPRTTS